MPNYILTIKPLEYYFFGGEKHDDQLKTHYFVESLPYPQQTTIAGLIRYLLLYEKDLLDGKTLSIDSKAEAQELIGIESFKYGENLDFKKIKTISPLYFNNGSQNFYFAPFDIHFQLSDKFVLIKDNKVYIEKRDSHLIQQHLLSQDKKVICKLTDVVKNIQQVGNEKAEKGGAKENAFYKNNSKRMVENWAFRIDAEIDLVDLAGKEYFLPFGGERNFFKISIQNGPSYSHPLADTVFSRKKFYMFCASDCFADETVIKQAKFAVNDFISFRNFRSSIHTKSYYALNAKEDISEGVIRSSRYQLLKRGSVLYFDNIHTRDEIVNGLKKNPAHKIGFNHTITN